MYYGCLGENFLVFKKEICTEVFRSKGAQCLQFTLKWLRKIYTHMCMYISVCARRCVKREDVIEQTDVSINHWRSEIKYVQEFTPATFPQV